ncbi:MAG TPA: TadE/TadG family type IV pilus assembly protein [Caulobacteraceae bacterium]|jgi:Flp pilus assembly protein TadG|nr:TadE/TadG family type IV pilus assembly protein [Caulobacteraceae bacterium]
MHLKTMLADRRGVAAVEFALLAPILLLLYFGVVELTQGLMTQERAAHTASTIGDLTAQSTTIDQAEITDIFAMGNTIMYPYPTTSLQMRLSSLVADKNGNVTVAWSEGQGMTALGKGSTVSGLPSNVINANESVIMAETKYTYTSVFGQIMPSPVIFNEKYYLRPRASTSVTCSDC